MQRDFWRLHPDPKLACTLAWLEAKCILKGLEYLRFGQLSSFVKLFRTWYKILLTATVSSDRNERSQTEIALETLWKPCSGLRERSAMERHGREMYSVATAITDGYVLQRDDAIRQRSWCLQPRTSLTELLGAQHVNSVTMGDVAAGRQRPEAVSHRNFGHIRPKSVPTNK